MGMLARSNVAKWLQNNNQFDEEAIISEEIADNDPDLYIFKFIRKYAPELPFVIAGLPLSAQTIIRCLTDGGEAGTYVVSLFADGKIKKFFPLLPAQILDPMLEAFAEADWKKDVRVAFAATVASENFYWGPSGAPRTALERIKFAQRHPSLLAMTVWRERGGPAFVIPPDIAALFNDDKYDEAIASLFERAKCHRLLKTDDLREKYAANVFTRSETDYAREVYRKIEGDPRFLSLRSEIRSFAESDGSGREHIEISGANPYAGIDLESILRALREAAPESVRGPLETFLEIDDPEEIFKRVRENDDIFHGSSPIFAPGNGAPLFDIIFGGSGYQEFESALKNMATKISERYDVQFEFAPDLSRRLWELSRTNPDLSRGDFMKKYLTDPFALALYETDAAPGPWLATDMEATDDFVRLNLERI